MGLFGRKKKDIIKETYAPEQGQEQESIKKITRDNRDPSGSFMGFVLLSEAAWDRDKFIDDLKNDWDIDISAEKGEEDDIIYADADGFRMVLGLMPGPIPNGEAEHFAKANYMWRDAVETVESHRAHLLITVLGDDLKDVPDKDANIKAKGRLFVKVVCAVLKQETALALYSEGAVYEPKMYLECAQMLKTNDIPILNWIWFGIYGDGKKAGVYTFGMRRFGKEEIEVYVDADKANLEELRGFVLNIAVYVIDCNVILQDGETIGFSEEQKLPITVSKGIAVDGNTVKIAL